MRKIFILFFIFIFSYSVYYFRFDLYSLLIEISGKIEIENELEKNIRPNTMLYIKVRNDKNIIFAIKEIINPVFPVNFSINRKNVLYPDISSFNIKIETTINSHGEVGKIKPGDIYSKPIEANIFSRNIKIKIDRTR